MENSHIAAAAFLSLRKINQDFASMRREMPSLNHCGCFRIFPRSSCLCYGFPVALAHPSQRSLLNHLAAANGGGLFNASAGRTTQMALDNCGLS
jgi:hypothetical protein